MRTQRAAILVFPIALALFGLLAGARRPPAESPIRGVGPSEPTREMARVTFVSGQAEVRGAGQEWTPLRSGAAIGAGDTVRTGSAGRVEIRANDTDRILRIERETLLVMQGRLDGDRVEIVGGQLREGRLWLGGDGGARDFRVNTADTQLDPDGSVLSVSRDETGDTVTLFEGEARLASVHTGAQYVLSAGTGATSGPDGVVRFEVDGRDDWRDGWLTRQPESGTAEDPGAKRSVPVAVRKTQDLRDLSPDVYLGVEVELGGRETPEAFEMSSARIRRIRVRAGAWDGLAADRRVSLLNDTFSLLKGRYPNIRHSVVLEFDDGRPDLPLRYATDLRG